MFNYSSHFWHQTQNCDTLRYAASFSQVQKEMPIFLVKNDKNEGTLKSVCTKTLLYHMLQPSTITTDIKEQLGEEDFSHLLVLFCWLGIVTEWGTKESLYLFFLQPGTLKRHPEGRSWNSSCRTWAGSRAILSACLSVSLVQLLRKDFSTEWLTTLEQIPRSRKNPDL